MVSVNNEGYIFLTCVLGGMIIAFIYDIFRIRRKAIKAGNLIVYFEDFIYWIIVALVMFGVVYYSNDGEVRGYLFVGTVIGIILYALLLSRIITSIFIFIIKILYKVILALITAILFPLKILYKIFSIPLRFIWGNVKKVLKKLKRMGKSKIGKFGGIKSGLKRNLRKICKKI